MAGFNPWKPREKDGHGGAQLQHLFSYQEEEVDRRAAWGPPNPDYTVHGTGDPASTR